MNSFDVLSAFSYAELNFVCALIVCVMGVIAIRYDVALNKHVSRFLYTSWIGMLVFMVSDGLWAIEEYFGVERPFFFYLYNGLFFTGLTVSCFFWFLYVGRRYNAFWGNSKTAWYVSSVPALYCLYLIFSAPVNHQLFFLNADLQYDRGPYFVVLASIQSVYMIMAGIAACVYAFRNSGQEKKLGYFTTVFTIPVFASTICQLLFKVNLVAMGYTLACLWMFICEMTMLTSQHKQAKSEIEVMQQVDQLLQEKILLQEERARQLALTDLFVQAYAAAYYVDMSNDSCLVIKQDADVKDRYPELSCFSRAIDKYIEDDVYADDKEKIHNAVQYAYIRQRLKQDRQYAEAFRDLMHGPEPQYYRMHIVRGHDDDHCAIGFVCVNEEYALVRSEHENKRNLEIITELIKDYESVDYVKLGATNMSDISRQYRQSPLFNRIIPGWDAETVFHNRLELLADHLVCKDEREEFLRKTRRSLVLATMKDSPEPYYVNFKAVIDGVDTYYQLKFITCDMDENGSISGFVVGIHAVDSETRREKQLMGELREAKEIAETANRAKTAFLFNMSHDIRTPMNAIVGFTNMALKRIEDTELATEYLHKAQHSTDLLLSIINDILDMSRIESGRVILNENKADMLLCYNEIGPMFMELAESNNISLDLRIGEIHDRYAYLDFVRTERVLTNVISNAIKYTNPGGSVDVLLEQGDCDIPGRALYRFIISDNGIGMSEEFQKHVFEEFSREESTTKSGIQGTGLGLSLSKALVELMGGTITVISKQGEGSVFTIELPLRIQEGKEHDRTLTQEDIDLGTIFEGKRVLVVDDNDINNEIAVSILEGEKMIVETASGGEQAVLMYGAHPDGYYDYVLMDIQMPIVDGYEATRRIRAKYPERRTPIIALSANAFEEDKAASLAAGMDDHISKPINLRQLKLTLKKYLRDEASPKETDAESRAEKKPSGKTESGVEKKPASKTESSVEKKPASKPAAKKAAKTSKE